jgi:hypothetical protein
MCKFSNQPKIPHLDIVKHLLTNVKGTMDVSISYVQGKVTKLASFSNAN